MKEFDLDLGEIVKEAASALPSDVALEELSALAQRQLDMERQITDAEKVLDDLKQRHAQLTEGVIPEAMTRVGMREVRLMNGFLLSVSPFYSAKITSDAAHVWLEDNGYGDLIKGTITVNYPKDTDQEEITEVMNYLEDLGLMANNKVAVHPSTLRAWVKSMIETGKPIPRELFNVYAGQRSKLSIK